MPHRAPQSNCMGVWQSSINRHVAVMPMAITIAHITPSMCTVAIPYMVINKAVKRKPPHAVRWAEIFHRRLIIMTAMSESMPPHTNVISHQPALAR